MATRMNGLYLRSKIYNLEGDRYMKHRRPGGLLGRRTCKEESIETVRRLRDRHQGKAEREQ